MKRKTKDKLPPKETCPKCGQEYPEWEFGHWLDSNEPPVCTKCEPQRRLEL